MIMSAIPLASGIVNFDSGTYWDQAQYGIDGSGVVHLKGMIKNTNPYTSGNVVLGTLPVGFRPTTTAVYDVTVSYAKGNIHIDPTGVITLIGNGGTDYVSIAGISFPTT